MSVIMLATSQPLTLGSSYLVNIQLLYHTPEESTAHSIHTNNIYS